MGILRCYFCGKFIGYNEPYYAWKFADKDYDLSNNEFAHSSCYENNERSSPNSISRISMFNPVKYNE